MASILRSSKFLRYVAGFARHVVINPPREFENNFINTAQCFCSVLPRNFVTQATIQNEQNLELSIKRLDQDVRRSGRISRRDIEDVLEEIRSTRSATTSQSLMVIRCCGNLVPEELPEVRTRLVQEIWNTLVKLNVPMDISHYNALLRVYLENKHQFLPTEFLTELEAKSIVPNRVTYQRLITRYCEMGDIEGATRILEFMKEKQFPVNENVFNSLIMGHFQLGDPESAQAILAVMSQAGLEPSADTYTTLLCGYAKLGDFETIKSLLKDCFEKEIYLLDSDYLNIVYELAINGHEQHIPEILNQVRKALGYTQDAVNIIYRLINNGQEDAAFLVLQSMPRNTLPDGKLQPSGAFFVRQLVKANRPVNKILEICEQLKKEELHSSALLLAAQTSFTLGNEEIAFGLLAEMHTKNLEIRQHYFWPLIVAQASDISGDGIIRVLQEMQKYNISPTSETIREYVIPNIKGNSSTIISKLREANISVGSAACHLLYCLLVKDDIEEGAVIVNSVNAYYIPSVLKKPLSHALHRTQDIKSYIAIIRGIYENSHRRDSVVGDGDTLEAVNKNEIVGELIHNLTYDRNFPNIAVNVLEALVNEGLSITNAYATKIQDALGENLTPEVASLLAKLSSGELMPAPLIKKPIYTPADQMNASQLERLIHNLSIKGQDTVGLQRQLLTLYCRAKELTKIEDLLKQLENGSFNYSAGVYAQLMDVYAYHDNLEESLKYYEKIKEFDNNFALDDIKVIRLVGLLIKNNRFEEGLNFLNSQTRERRLDERSYPYTAQCWKILNSLAEEGKEHELNTLFDALLKNDFIEVSNVLLGPLVKVHLINNDVNKALEKFEWCCTQFKATPSKNELTCKLIQLEDAENLQKLTDLSTSVHGEINSLYDLVFAFVDCGRIRQARKILETPGLYGRPQRFNSICQRYQQEGMTKSLEGLKDATKDLNHIDRSDIYYQLLLSYIKQDEVDKALGLWTQLQEEDMTPTDQFLVKLGNFLTEKNMSIPFIMPQHIPEKERVREIKEVTQNRQFFKNDWQLFRNAIRAKDVTAAIKYKSNLRDPISVLDGSHYIELLLLDDRLNEAKAVLLDMVSRSTNPITRVFRFILNKLSNEGDLETLALISSKINSEYKKLLSFDNRLCHAHIVAGKAEEYLNILEREIDNAKDSEIAMLAEKFPRGGVVGILERAPESVDKYENVALKYAAKGILSPINVLWSHYFTTGNDEKAKEIWKSYLENTPRVMFQRVLQKARETCDEDLVKKLIQQLKQTRVTEGAFGNVYSCLLDILVAKGNPEEVVSAFQIILKDTKIEFINQTALLRVKQIHNQLGKPFDYAIPPKSRTNANVGNSDDDIELQKNMF